MQVGSALASRSIPLQAAYGAAKHALNGFTESLRSELIHDRSSVRVNRSSPACAEYAAVHLGSNRMPRKPRPPEPIYQPEIAARAIRWATHHRRRQVLVGGPTVIAVAADKLAPALADRYLGEDRVSVAAVGGARIERSARQSLSDRAGDFGRARGVRASSQGPQPGALAGRAPRLHSRGAGRRRGALARLAAGRASHHSMSGIGSSNRHQRRGAEGALAIVWPRPLKVPHAPSVRCGLDPQLEDPFGPLDSGGGRAGTAWS